MPAHMAPTMAEREAELAALQSAFDEYIASSRELEEELDAELAKMRKFDDLASCNETMRNSRSEDGIVSFDEFTSQLEIFSDT